MQTLLMKIHFLRSDFIPLSGQDVHEFEQELTEHLWTGGGQVDLQAAQELVHGLGGGGSHLRAVLARPVGAAA